MVKLPCVLQVQIMTDDERARDHTTVKNPDLFLSHTGNSANSANASQPKVAITSSWGTTGTERCTRVRMYLFLLNRARSLARW